MRCWPRLVVGLVRHVVGPIGSSLTPRATTRRLPSGSGLCNFSTSSAGAVIQVSTSSGVVRITGIGASTLQGHLEGADGDWRLVALSRQIANVFDQYITYRSDWVFRWERDGTAPAELRQVLETMYRNLVRRRGLTPAEARRRLLLAEPFDAYPDVVAALPDLPESEN